MSKRVFFIILDSFGIGEALDSYKFDSIGANTLLSCSKSMYFNISNMQRLGLYNIEGVRDNLSLYPNPIGCFARLEELSAGKDTPTGHWELCGCISKNPLPTYPNGFPDYILQEFMKQTGRGYLCNKPYSGTEVIKDYGEESIKTGNLIIYTSADSVFQIAADENTVGLDNLYRYCRDARNILKGKDAVGRVIARPFIKDENGNFIRTGNRHDFSLEPVHKTILDSLKENGLDVIGVGKINDIFAGRGITEYVYTPGGNDEGINQIFNYLNRDFNGLCFINLVDFDMLYGHRRDVSGYSKALSKFDFSLGEILSNLRDDDILMISADHGCDPLYYKHTDHTREYVPLLMYGKKLLPTDYGTRCFSDAGKTILSYFGINDEEISGTPIF